MSKSDKSLYNEVLNNPNYLEVVKKIEKIKFITDGKWDWEHGLGHFQRVAFFVRDILLQLNACERTIDLGMIAALLHDVGLIKGEKSDHAIESSKMFLDFIPKGSITILEEETLRQAIEDHSKGNNIKSLIGLALVLADKLDVTYHRTLNSSIQDTMNKEIQKIKKVSIKITNEDLIVNYETDSDFHFGILKAWSKAITIPYKVAMYLNKNFLFLINDYETDTSEFFK